MRLSSLCFVVALLFPAGELLAQATPRTVAAAEAEGAAVRTVPNGRLQATIAARSYAGTSERRCVVPPAEDSLANARPLRSGDIVARAPFTGRWGFRSGKAHKVLWQPLHLPSEANPSLLIRAARIGSASDSLRQTIAKPTQAHGEGGYPSSIEFPAPGQWLVLAAVGADWGCFIVTVVD